MRKKVGTLVVLFVVVLLAFGLAACGSKKSDEPAQEEVAQQDEEAARKAEEEEQKRKEEEEAAAVVYPDDKRIDAFVRAWNETYPEMAFTSESLEPFYHHGTTHKNQVNTEINGMPVTISSEGFSRPYNVSVYYAAIYDEGADAASTNRELFGYVMHVAFPSLSEEEIQARWQEFIDQGYGSFKWDDGSEIDPSSTYTNKGDGSYGYIKIFV